jgi:hypothetical protein
MTQQQGLFTIQTWLSLTPEHRARLEWLVREEGGDPADTLTRIVDAADLGAVHPADDRPAGDPLPVRVYLSPEQRAAFDQLVEEHKTPLPDILSQLVAAHLADLPTPPAREESPPPDTAAETRRRRNELARLRARRDAAGATAPAWLHAYIAELESELGLQRR